MKTTAHLAEQGHRFTLTANPDRTAACESVQIEVGNAPAGPAGHLSLLGAQVTKEGVSTVAGAGQVHTAAAVAAPPLGVVVRKATQLALTLLRFKLRLLCLRAQIGVLALQRPDALSKQGQVLSQHRSRATFVDKRLHLIQQRLKHFILRKPFAADGSAA